MHPCVFIICSLILICFEATRTHQLVDANGVINKCLDEEKHALLDFKSRLQDPDGVFSSWSAEEEKDCCKWSRVMCNNKTGYVTKLDLPNDHIRGEISPSLFNLSYLRHLDLSNNFFLGTIPSSIGSLTRLRYLDLSQNNFNGTIPRSLGSLTGLRYLYLSYNSLYGTIPKSIGSLTELRSLDFSYNSLYGTIPSEFGNLTNLEELFLQSIGRCRVENIEWLSRVSQLEALIIDGISFATANHWVNVIPSLPNLSHLSLMECELSQVMYPYTSFLNSSSSIVEFILQNNNINSSVYHWLFPLTNNKLELLDLSSNMLDGIPKYLGNLCSLTLLYMHNNFVVVKLPDFLQNLAGCTSLTLIQLDASYSQFTGSLSDDIQKFSSLQYLYLSENQLNGTLSEKLWELPKLKTLDLSFNYLRGPISKKIGKSKFFVLDLSENLLEGVHSIDLMSSISYIEYIDLSSCKIGPHFPKWILSLKNLTRLNLANTRISDTIPLEFWETWPSRLQYLNLSSNNISGNIPDLLLNIYNYSVIDLSSNNFHGPIQNVPSTLASLNLSRNKFYGGISFLCEIVHGFLKILDLSHNSLTGQLPDCLWHFKELKFLNLGHNNLSGRLPTSLQYLIQLEVLYLYKNEFFGELSSSLQNCTSLKSLNLGANKFSGNVPVWIEGNLFGLYVLVLRSNNFRGTIPLQLCQLVNLQILDLSMNNLDGSIPSCVNNIVAMTQEGFPQEQNVHQYSLDENVTSVLMNAYIRDGRYVDHALVGWQGDEREFMSTLGLLKIIDLSSNNLTRQIPDELANLHELLALNLSNNALLGNIPREIGQMKKLIALDLSRNNFSGSIPSSMSQMTLLSYLDLSSNNLSERIPSSTQLQSFEPSRYNGNVGLCGPPLPKVALVMKNLKYHIMLVKLRVMGKT